MLVFLKINHIIISKVKACPIGAYHNLNTRATILHHHTLYSQNMSYRGVCKLFSTVGLQHFEQRDRSGPYSLWGQLSRLWIYPAPRHEVGQKGHGCAVPTGLGPAPRHPLPQGSRPKSSTTTQEHIRKGIGKYLHVINGPNY